jgi:hypothetical protein
MDKMRDFLMLKQLAHSVNPCFIGICANIPQHIGLQLLIVLWSIEASEECLAL